MNPKRTVRATQLACVALGTLCATLAWPKIASAYQPNLCNGQLRALRTARSFEIDRCAAPVGSAQETSLLYAMDRWNGLAGIADRFFYQHGTFCGILDEWNGHWELTYVPSDHPLLDGNLGTTKGYTRPCQSPYDANNDGHALEIDAVIDEALEHTAAKELDEFVAARDTWLHELGHVLGMNHIAESWEASVMMPYSPPRVGTRGVGSGATFGGRADAPLPDDLLFVTDYHGTSSLGSADPTVSPWHLEPNSFWGAVGRLNYNWSNENVEACPGDQLDVSISFANIGKRDFADWVGFEIMVSSNSIISVADTAAGGGGFWANPGSFFTVEWPITVPNRAAGTYYVGLLADPDEVVSEAYELNNSMRTGLMLTIPSGC
jgi:hypothetical protein